jgi:glycosyltransferase involved in cell wall biosynthesis
MYWGEIYKMKIVHVCRVLDIGGIEVLLKNLVSSPILLEHDQNIVCLNNDNGPLKNDIVKLGIGVQRLYIDNVSGKIPNPSKLRKLFYVIQRIPKAVRLIRLLRGLKADILHIHFPWYLTEQLVAAKLAGTKVVWTVHGYHRIDNIDKQILLIAQKLLGQNHFIVTAVSEEARSLTLPFIDNQIRNIRIIHNGVKIEDYGIETERTREKKEKLLGENNRIIVGSVGRLVDDKGYDVLLEAISLSEYLREGALFLIAGDGQDRQELEQQIIDLGLDDTVTLLGELDNIPEILQLFDIYIQPSRREGMPLAVIEAMASKLPIIASNIGGISKLLDSGEAGILVEKENPSELSIALIKMIENEELRDHYRDKAFQQAQTFSIDKIAGEYVSLYEKMLNNQME